MGPQTRMARIAAELVHTFRDCSDKRRILAI